jgi:hypothetical protein
MDTTSTDTPPEHRSDVDMREIFVPVFALMKPYMEPNGHWISQLHEILALQLLGQQFPQIQGERLFLLIAAVASTVASGRIPV